MINESQLKRQSQIVSMMNESSVSQVKSTSQVSINNTDSNQLQNSSVPPPQDYDNYKKQLFNTSTQQIGSPGLRKKKIGEYLNLSYDASAPVRQRNTISKLNSSNVNQKGNIEITPENFNDSDSSPLRNKSLYVAPTYSVSAINQSAISAQVQQPFGDPQGKALSQSSKIKYSSKVQQVQEHLNFSVLKNNRPLNKTFAAKSPAMQLDVSHQSLKVAKPSDGKEENLTSRSEDESMNEGLEGRSKAETRRILKFGPKFQKQLLENESERMLLATLQAENEQLKKEIDEGNLKMALQQQQMKNMESRLDKFNKEAMLGNYLEKVDSAGSEEEVKLDTGRDLLFHDIIESNNKVQEQIEHTKKLELDYQHKIKLIKQGQAEKIKEIKDLFDKELAEKDKVNTENLKQLKRENAHKILKEKEYEQKLIEKERETNEVLMRQQEICDEYEKELTQKDKEVRQMQEILDTIENQTVEQDGEVVEQMQSQIRSLNLTSFKKEQELTLLKKQAKKNLYMQKKALLDAQDMAELQEDAAKTEEMISKKKGFINYQEMDKKLNSFKKLCDDYEQEIEEQDQIIENLIEESKKNLVKKKTQRIQLPTLSSLQNQAFVEPVKDLKLKQVEPKVPSVATKTIDQYLQTGRSSQRPKSRILSEKQETWRKQLKELEKNNASKKPQDDADDYSKMMMSSNFYDEYTSEMQL